MSLLSPFLLHAPLHPVNEKIKQNTSCNQNFWLIQGIAKYFQLPLSLFLPKIPNTKLITHSLTPRHYNPCRVLADSRSRLQPSLSLASILQFVTPSLSASLITPSIHLRFGLPTRLLPSGLYVVKHNYVN